MDATITIPDGALEAWVADRASETQRDGRPVRGTVRRIAGGEGRALDRTTAATDLREALTGAAAAVDLQVPTVRPARDVSDLRDVLVVHQSRRVVELYNLVSSGTMSISRT